MGQMYYKTTAGELIAIGTPVGPIQEGLDPATGTSGYFFYDTDAPDPAPSITQAQADGWYVNRLSSSTDNAIARFDGVTGSLQNSSNITLDDNGQIALSNVNQLRVGPQHSQNDGVFTANRDGAGSIIYLVSNNDTSAPSRIRGWKAGGTYASRSSVANSNPIFQLDASGWNGSSYETLGYINFSVDSTGTVSSTSMPGRIQFYTTPDGSNTGAERMTINNAGNVAINGSVTDLGSTSRSLTVNSGTSVAGAAAYSAVFTSAEGRTLQMLVSNQNGVQSMGTRSNHPLNITTNDTPRIAVDASGRVTLPYQPAFTARSAQATTQGNDVIWDTVDYQVGTYYNSTNGRFTAPVAGYYYFHSHGLWANGDSGDRRMALYKNGVAAFPGMRFISNKAVNVWQTWLVDGVVYMAQGDWATVRVETSGAGLHTDNNYNQFSGYLLG